jgi:hypothetical protein
MFRAFNRSGTDLEAPSGLDRHPFGDDLGRAWQTAAEHTGKDAVFSDVFGKLFEITEGTFSVEPIEIWRRGRSLSRRT